MGTRQHVDPECLVHQAPPRLRRSERRAASCVDAASRAWWLLARALGLAHSCRESEGGGARTSDETVSDMSEFRDGREETKNRGGDGLPVP